MSVTATQLVTNGILRATLTTARNITLPDADDVLDLIGTAVGTTVRFTYINLAATNVATFVAGANTTSVGALTVAGSSSASFLIFVASATTITIIRA